MGLLDRFAKRVADAIEKAPNLPAGSVTLTQDQMQGALGQAYGNSNPLPRDANLAGIPFGPATPIIPSAINPTRSDGRADPRRYEYQVAQNINVSETRLVPFKTLRAAADQIDIVRRCVEAVKYKLTGLDWDIVLGEDSTEKIIAEGNDSDKSHAHAQQEARVKYNDEINRLRQFWEMPDPANGLTFSDWLTIAIEEILVLDAWAVWAQPTVGGDVYGLQILDGSTIKPMIDDRGMRPMAPQPAFQQILYGFPRSEFAAPSNGEEADGEFDANELTYMVRNRRSFTTYGFSPVERCLPVADIYLRRQQWLRTEFTDGVLPDLMFTTDANFGGSPDLLRAYENILNDDLAGQTEQRHRARILPQGLNPIQMQGYGERFSNTLDEYLINSVCGHFGLMPSELGFAPKNGLGGSGHQEGQAESAENIGLIPFSKWLGTMLSQLSYNYLGMPRELEFRFMPSSRQETIEATQRMDIQRKNGGITLNEQRSRDGLPLLNMPEADYPMIVAPTGAFFLTDEGLIPVGGSQDPMTAFMSGMGSPEGAAPEAEPETPTKEEEAAEAVPEPVGDIEQSARAEVKRFVRWVQKSPDRAFNFEYTPAAYAEVLNKFVTEKDFDSARWYAERFLS